MKKIIVALLIVLNLLGLGQKIFAKGSIEEDLSGEYFSIAEAYTELKKYDKAIDYFKKAEKSKSYKRASHYNLAQVYALKKDWTNCTTYLKPLHEQAPDNIKIATAYAYALASSGKQNEALSLYKKIYDKNPETPEYFFNYVRLLIVVKDYDTAKKMLEEAKEKFKENEENKTISHLEKKIEQLLNPPKKEKPKSKTKKESKPSKP